MTNNSPENQSPSNLEMHTDEDPELQQLMHQLAQMVDYSGRNTTAAAADELSIEWADATGSVRVSIRYAFNYHAGSRRDATTLSMSVQSRPQPEHGEAQVSTSSESFIFHDRLDHLSAELYSGYERRAITAQDIEQYGDLIKHVRQTLPSAQSDQLHQAFSMSRISPDEFLPS